MKPFNPGELLAFIKSITGLPEERRKALDHVSKGTDWDVSGFAKNQ
jgi:hypothetical protein